MAISPKIRKMRQQLVIISALIGIAVGLQGLKLTFFPSVTGYTAYGFNSLTLVLIFVTIVLVLNLIYLRLLQHQSPMTADNESKRHNRRRSYRITYPAKCRPRLVIETTDRILRRELEFTVIDLSQDGVCFNDDGSLGVAGNLSGCIKVSNENKLSISGRVVRLKGNQVCVQFFQPISWTTLLAEQRRLLRSHSADK